MTITQERTKYEFRDTDHYKQVAERVAAWPALPTVDDLGGPIVRSLQALHDLGEEVDIYGLDFAIEHGEFHEEADALIALVEGVANAVEIAVGMFLTSDEKGMHAANARAMVLGIFNMDAVRIERHRPTHERLAYPDD